MDSVKALNEEELTAIFGALKKKTCSLDTISSDILSKCSDLKMPQLTHNLYQMISFIHGTFSKYIIKHHWIFTDLCTLHLIQQKLRNKYMRAARKVTRNRSLQADTGKAQKMRTYLSLIQRKPSLSRNNGTKTPISLTSQTRKTSIRVI